VNFESWSCGRRRACRGLVQIDHACQVFNIVLVDFLSALDKRGFMETRPYLSRCRGLLKHRSSTWATLSHALRDAARKFVRWLNTECTIEKVWLPSVKLGDHAEALAPCVGQNRRQCLPPQRSARRWCRSGRTGILAANGIALSLDQACRHCRISTSGCTKTSFITTAARSRVLEQHTAGNLRLSAAGI